MAHSVYTDSAVINILLCLLKIIVDLTYVLVLVLKDWVLNPSL